ncbi:HI1506-related protein [Gallaecimonas xiamenensis]|uniref:Rho termination factor domain protein n=1 Tax=Gallaecimonas xiamenensis 3-C-1 TaxID=745411 RepID=K2KD66_9GAMM|nr:HI1506-related protein [Gallaecimonas xiamenensis]EKE75190.1 Rho termination factor domain protein [Gallaecimonas xiamenensis 3-C-1]
MSKTTIYTALVVASIAHDGYRRAGLGFKKGDNAFANQPLTDAQLAAIEADPRLSIKKAEAQSANAAPGGALDASDVVDPVTFSNEDGFIAGVVDHDGKQIALADMTVKDLKTIAKDLDVEGYSKLSKDALVDAIQAVKVQAATDGAEA